MKVKLLARDIAHDYSLMWIMTGRYTIYTIEFSTICARVDILYFINIV